MRVRRRGKDMYVCITSSCVISGYFAPSDMPVADLSYASSITLLHMQYPLYYYLQDLRLTTTD